MSFLRDDAVGRRISRRLLRVKCFLVHLIATIVIAVGMTAAADRSLISKAAVDVVIPAAILVFIAHALWITYQESTDLIVRQEAGRADDDWDEKPKHDGRLVLGDDGELVEIDPDDLDEPYEAKRKRD